MDFFPAEVTMIFFYLFYFFCSGRVWECFLFLHLPRPTPRSLMVVPFWNQPWMPWDMTKTWHDLRTRPLQYICFEHHKLKPCTVEHENSTALKFSILKMWINLVHNNLTILLTAHFTFLGSWTKLTITSLIMVRFSKFKKVLGAGDAYYKSICPF